MNSRSVNSAAEIDIASASERGSSPRTTVLHYHLFKNAGTSIDDLLRRNFAPFWAEHEFEGAGKSRSNVEAVARYLRERPELIALSSHTALLPAPRLDGISVFPIIFVRHPIDRLRSAYLFEREQRVDTAGARLAKAENFRGYLRTLMDLPRRQVRNFHTARLARNEPPESGTERERALRALDTLPFVGLVEAYQQSIGRLEILLRPVFPRFRATSAHRNATQRGGPSLGDRLAAIERELGADFFAELCAANRSDLDIYRRVRARFAAEEEPPRQAQRFAPDR